ncbi:MAG: hypothetical protein GEV08_16930 [Acidimicrobiia bacterium]|nr:hypothetical protein [Acidimicrobiia bacterium]
MAPSVPAYAEILERAERLRPLLAGQTAASEAARRVTDESITAMKEAGMFRLLSSRLYGGWETSLRAQATTAAIVAQGCAATSWLQMVLGAHTWVLGSFPPGCQDEVFGPSPDVLIAGTLSSQGTARQVEGGWMVQGRWQFCSGVDHADWLLVGTLQRDTPDGKPRSLHVVLPLADALVDDTWFTLGMRATGSKDLVLEDVFVPEHRTMPTGTLFDGRSPHAARHETNLYKAPVISSLALQAGGTILGMARAAYDAIVERTRVRKEVYTAGRKADSAGTQRRVAEAHAELVSAELLLQRTCGGFEALAETGRPATLEERAELKWGATYPSELCRRAVERLYAASGAHAVYDDAPLQRMFRDINTVVHHAAIDLDSTAEMYGRVALGLPPGTPIL